MFVASRERVKRDTEIFIVRAQISVAFWAVINAEVCLFCYMTVVLR